MSAELSTEYRLKSAEVVLRCSSRDLAAEQPSNWIKSRTLNIWCCAAVVTQLRTSSENYRWLWRHTIFTHHISKKLLGMGQEVKASYSTYAWVISWKRCRLPQTDLSTMYILALRLQLRKKRWKIYVYKLWFATIATTRKCVFSSKKWSLCATTANYLSSTTVG